MRLPLTAAYAVMLAVAVCSAFVIGTLVAIGYVYEVTDALRIVPPWVILVLLVVSAAAPTFMLSYRLASRRTD